MSGIFISYRRNDSQGSTGRLADALKARFSESEIFRDVDDIEDGVDFVETIDRALASCVALLAVIGPRWISIIDNKGRRRLDDPNDFTRTEIAAALKRNVRVIPVLVDGAVMPDPDELPDDLKLLARRNARELTDKRWEFDVQQLLATIEKIPGITAGITRETTPSLRPTPSPSPAPSFADLNGVWSDTYGNRYLVAQQGNIFSVNMVQNPFGRSAQGRGTIFGRTIAMEYGFYDPSIGTSIGRSTAEVAPDGSTIRGTYVETASGVQLPFLMTK